MFCQNYIMNKYKGIEIPIFNEFEKPIFVENRNFRTKNTKNYFDLSYKEVSNLTARVQDIKLIIKEVKAKVELV